MTRCFSQSNSFPQGKMSTSRVYYTDIFELHFSYKLFERVFLGPVIHLINTSITQHCSKFLPKFFYCNIA